MVRELKPDAAGRCGGGAVLFSVWGVLRKRATFHSWGGRVSAAGVCGYSGFLRSGGVGKWGAARGLSAEALQEVVAEAAGEVGQDEGTVGLEAEDDNLERVLAAASAVDGAVLPFDDGDVALVVAVCQVLCQIEEAGSAAVARRRGDDAQGANLAEQLPALGVVFAGRQLEHALHHGRAHRLARQAVAVLMQREEARGEVLLLLSFGVGDDGDEEHDDDDEACFHFLVAGVALWLLSAATLSVCAASAVASR